MERATFENELNRLTARISTLPAAQRASLLKLLEETKTRHAKIRAAADQARNAIDDWRLYQKYLAFDQEASLREFRDGKEREEG